MNKTQTTIKIILKLVTLLFNPMVGKHLSRTLAIIAHLRKNHGLPYTFNYMKSVRLHITRYICGKPLKTNSSHVSISGGWPTKFLFLKDLLTSDYNLQGLLTIVNVTRGIKPTSKEKELFKPDFTSITAPKTVSKDYYIPRFFIDVMKRKYNIDSELDQADSKDMFLNMKSSPTGISIVSSITATATLHLGLVQDLSILLSSKGFELLEAATMFCRKYTSFQDSSISPGKLGIVHDPEGKERVIAMLDYWSQWSLKPIHDKLFHILRRIPMDRTFSQDPFHPWKDDQEMFWSLDLSSATDRFPVALQVKILNSFLPEDISLAWRHLLVERSYSYQGNLYKYAVGQPMGAYSSWPAFAVSHHFVVQWAAYLCGYKDFTDYILLGDDIVIKNNRVAQKYISIMTKLGVEISQSKTHVSKDTYEFAKRWIRKGREISPLPLKGIMEHIYEPKTVMSLLHEWLMKTKFKASIPLLTLLKESYKRTRTGKQWNTEILLHKRLYDFWFALRFIHKQLHAEELHMYLVEKGYDETLLPTGEEVLSITKGILRWSVGKAISQIPKKVENLIIGLLKEWMKEYSFQELWFHPMIHANYNLLSRLIVDHTRFYKDFDNFKEILQTLTIPGITEIVHLKRQHRKEISGIDKVWNQAFEKFKEIVKVTGNYDPKSPKLVGGESSYYITQNTLQRMLKGLELMKAGKSVRPS